MNSLKSIVLIGFMGAGKSSVGRFLERRTGLARIDTDEMVSEKLGLSIPEIFSTLGEERFRDSETESLRELAPNLPSIIVTGGGIILRTENVDLLKRLGTIVWLDAEEPVLFERATRRGERPLLQGPSPGRTFAELMQKRRPLYESAADFRIDTSSLDHDEVAEIILKRLEEIAVSAKP